MANDLIIAPTERDVSAPFNMIQSAAVMGRRTPLHASWDASQEEQESLIAESADVVVEISDLELPHFKPSSLQTL